MLKIERRTWLKKLGTISLGSFVPISSQASDPNQLAKKRPKIIRSDILVVAGADSTTSESNTITNIMGRTSLLNTLRFLQELPGCEKIKLISMQPETGVRETYRIEGEYQISSEDYITGRIFEDSVSYSFYPIDVHDKNGVEPKQLKEGILPTVPLRSLIPKASKNILVAGRCISSDRLANSALRVQASCMGMGQVAASAAVLAIKYHTTPLQVPIEKLKAFLKENGAIVP